jgi:hypothetical protein
MKGNKAMATTVYTAGPWSSWGSNDSVGQQAQLFYNFLEAVYENPQVRIDLFAKPSEAAVKDYLQTTWGIIIPDEVRMMLVDIENAITKSYINDPRKDPFYVMVIPPDLRKKPSTDASYKEAQALSGAWFHATNDGWGM